MMNSDELQRAVKAYIESQRGWVIETLSKLIGFQSLPGSEAEVIAFFKTLTRDVRGELLQIPVPDSLKSDTDYCPSKEEQPYSERPNLVNFRRGRGGGRSLILCGHADVVPANWPGAFDARVEGDIVYGRGACDDKGPLLAGLLALRALDQLGIETAGDLETQIVIEEELGGNGALALILGGRRADGVVVLEASDLAICPAGRGALWFKVDVEGRSTHMAYILEGVSAAKEAIKAVQALERYERRLIEDSRGNPMFDGYEQPVMVNFGMLHSGDWPATVPQHAVIEGGVGFLPNRNLDVVRREVAAVLRDEAGEWVRDHHTVSFERLHNEAYQLAADHPLTTALSSACATAGLEPDVRGLIASCDARLYYHRGAMPPLVFGPGSIRDAHSREERVKIGDILRAAESLVYLTREWCGWVEA
jgi:acetylornithine deacetylase